MALTITILTVSGTLPSGRDKLSALSFNVSSTSSFDRELVSHLGCREAYMDLDDTTSAIEIGDERLLTLRIDTSLNMIDGECFDGNGHDIAELARAQTVARTAGARVLIGTGF